MRDGGGCTSTVQLNTQGLLDQLQDVCEELQAKHAKVSFISFKELNADKILQNKVYPPHPFACARATAIPIAP